MTSYANNGLNQVTSVAGTGVSYDTNGNITNDATRSFTYDAANRLTSANGGTSTLSYDPLGRLYDYVGAHGGKYLYDGAETAGFATSGTTLNTRFVRGPGVDEIVANFTSAGSTPAQYWAADERGSLVNLTSGSTGATTVINTYDEYGVPASGNLGRLQYTGQLWMPDFGAYHYKARAYQPGIGRFLQTDPMGYAAGMNLYGYVGGDPVNLVDSLGLDGKHLPGGESECMLKGGFIVATKSDKVDHNECHFPDPFWGGGRGPGGGAFGGGGGDGGKDAVACPTGGTFSPTGNLGLTGFLLFGGINLGVTAGVAFPNEFFSTGSLAGLQIYGQPNISILGGLGAFYGGGPSVGWAASHGPVQGGWSNIPIASFGAAWGLGVELSSQIGSWTGGLGDLNADYQVGGSGGPDAGFGGYIAGGNQTSYTFTTPQLFCK